MQPFAWLSCGGRSACAEWLLGVGLRVDSGEGYGADGSFVRLIMSGKQSSFELMLQRLEAALRTSADKRSLQPLPSNIPSNIPSNLPSNLPSSQPVVSLPGTAANLQRGDSLPAQYNRLNVHQHIVPLFYASALQAHNISQGKDVPIWRGVEDTLATMARHYVRSAVLSISYPGIHFPQLGAAPARRLAVELASCCNAFVANVSRTAPMHFGGFATLPLPDVPASLREIRRALDGEYSSQPLDGVVLYTNYAGIYLGDRTFEPIMAELDRRQAVVFVHPVSPPTTPTPSLPFWLLDFVFDTTRTFVSMIQNGTFSRFPRIRWIAAHAGGTLPFLTSRIRELKGDPRYNVSGDPLQPLQQLYYDTTNVEIGPYAMRAVQELANLSRIVYGDDFPMMTEANLLLEHDGLQRYPGLSQQERDAIYRGNAHQLFPRFWKPHN